MFLLEGFARREWPFWRGHGGVVTFTPTYSTQAKALYLAYVPEHDRIFHASVLYIDVNDNDYLLNLTCNNINQIDLDALDTCIYYL